MAPLFSPPLTPDELYWCGLIHADGSIRADRMSVSLFQKDRHVIDEWLRFLGQDTKVTYVGRECGFGWSEGYGATTKIGVQRLLDLGVKGQPVPELYTSRHFWRGLIDGDGSVYLNKAGKNPQVWLTSGKHTDVVAFSEWIGRLFNCAGPKPYQAKSGWYVYVGSGKGRALAVYLYKDSYSAVPSKRDKALSFEYLVFRTSTPLLI